MRTLFFILLTIWTLGSWFVYTCYIKNACWGGTATTTTTIPNSKLQKPLVFKWSSYNIPLDSGFPDLKKAILATKEDGKVLELKGHYFDAETNHNSQYDLGFARASEVKKRLLTEIAEDRITISSASFSSEEVPNDSLVKAIEFQWVDGAYAEVEESATIIEEEPAIKEAPEIAIEDAAETDIDEEDYFVKYFPYNKTSMPDELTTFLDDLAERLIEEDRKVLIRGHTDSKGDKELNFKVGLRRAKKIRDQLIKRGVLKKHIETTSEGEDNPIGDNATEEGRQKNRRIEILIK